MQALGGRQIHQGNAPTALSRPQHRAARRTKLVASATAVEPARTTAADGLEDKFLARNLTQFKDVTNGAPQSLQKLHQDSWAALPALRMPTTRVEEYRFTDVSSLTRSNLVAADATVALTLESIKGYVPQEVSNSYMVVVNGVVRPELSSLSALPKGVYVGPLSQAPAAAAAKLGSQSSSRAGPFAVLNGAAARDALVVAVPEGAQVEQALYVLYLSTGGSAEAAAASAPRLLLHAAAGSSVTITEEFTSVSTATSGSSSTQSSSSSAAQNGAAAGDGSSQPPVYFSCSVAEVFLEKGAQVTHGYACREQAGAAHFKSTLVEQSEASEYALTEARLGGALTRHDVAVQQLGPSTSTTMRHFVLAGAQQLHDLHTKLVLDHPEGKADQLHKCIASAPTARGVFDGNVRVNRRAQRTDAGQLSRNLLLTPRATVNVKPNLQIIADDVKCTHGCAVSDLSEEELFYFRARGITALAARQALVNSFGAEVTQKLKLPALVNRLQADVKTALSSVDFAAAAGAQ